MILNDYYRFEKLPNQKSKMRLDCTLCTRSYNPFERLRKADKMVVYIGANTHTRAGEKRKSDLAMTNVVHITSIYTPEIEQPYWYGDVDGDALMMVHHDFKTIDGRVADGSIVEVFIARGQKHNVGALFTLMCDGELDAEMDRLRKQAASAKPDIALF